LKIAIVGAGVFGAAAALQLRRRGHAVTLLDPGPLPRAEAASTDTSKIVRVDYGADVLAIALAERALLRWRAWNDEWRRGGLAGPFHEDGLLVLSREPLRAGTFEGDSHALLTARGHALQRLRPGVLAARFPAWRAERYADGYWNPQGGWAESARVVEWLVGRARAAGAELREGWQAASLLQGRGRVTGVLARDAQGRSEPIPAELVVLAAGAWSVTALPELREDPPPLRIVAQSVFWFRPDRPQDFRPPAFPPFTADIGRTGYYGFPALPDGRVKIANHGPGLPLADADAPRRVPPAAEAATRAFLHEHLPGLADAPVVDSKLCLYCDTPDGHFLLDEHPRLPGLFLATGDSGHAFKFAPLLGDLVGDALDRRRDSAFTDILARCRWREQPAGRGDQARAGVP
jgi:glycine/D-amino acid oxidase-like deaminating enzyme